MQLLLSTNNAHKRAEFQGIFSGDDVLVPSELGLKLDVAETGTTFLENALLKARALHELVGAREDLGACHGAVVIADDSGLCVDALGGGPGIYSARFGSPDGGATELDATARNALLLETLAGVRERSARFVCCMVALLPGSRMVVAQESWPGTIAEEPSKASGGFGYDPVFVVPGRGVTAADLGDDEKNRISHRGRASRVLRAGLHAALGLD